jgi:hypothetical protein
MKNPYKRVQQSGIIPPSSRMRSRFELLSMSACSMRGRHVLLLINWSTFSRHMFSSTSRARWLARSPMQCIFSNTLVRNACEQRCQYTSLQSAIHSSRTATQGGGESQDHSEASRSYPDCRNKAQKGLQSMIPGHLPMY